ncbi:DNA-binding PadR family transcriptional regulator [Nonomuraea polychroma]|uniref:DNA-binding PadR family transcriptional regulator n=1 Tax=Nonomuraea polychroma TaxID=46176 RepID=A0A438MEC5_9ACTN|nr:PadR family transcriptional regulator [Nonomuraea polychroma]RVX44150.1 DNA-binding PadR family transcriptional regulator [Nonomuraea polychroma]
MKAVASPFGHGQFKLYLLALLSDQPRYGYEAIKLVEETFLGTYAPSAGSVYPRLSKLENEGFIVSAPDESGRKIYRITPDGKEELRRRAPELEELNQTIRRISDEVRRSAQRVRDEARHAPAVAREHQPPATAEEAVEQTEEAPRAITPEQWGPREWREALSWGAEWHHEWDSYFASGKTVRQMEKMLDRFRNDARNALREGVVDGRAMEECRQALGEALVRIRRATGT